MELTKSMIAEALDISGVVCPNCEKENVVVRGIKTVELQNLVDFQIQRSFQCESCQKRWSDTVPATREYEVEITRISSKTVTFTVTANLESDAQQKAEQQAKNFSFQNIGEDQADYLIGETKKR